MVENLLSTHEFLSSNPSNSIRKKKKGKNGGRTFRTRDRTCLKARAIKQLREGVNRFLEDWKQRTFIRAWYKRR